MFEHQQDLDRERDKKHQRSDQPPAPGRGNSSAALNGPTEPAASGITAGISSQATALMSAAEASPSRGLPDALREELEGELGAGLGGVRVHDGPEADAAAGALSARAYTVGSDIYFANGAYNPDSPAGRGLIAHEAAHVVQNGGSGSVKDGLQLSSPSDAHETEAHSFGEAFGSGMPTTAPVTRHASVGRAIVSRGEEDPVITPKNGQPGKGSGGASGKISTKSAAISPYVAFSKPLTAKDSVVDVNATLMLAGSGSLEWPDLMPEGGPSVDGGGGGKKATDKSSSSKQEVAVDKDFELYAKKVNEDLKNEKTLWQGLEVKTVKLVAGAGAERGSSTDAEGKKKNEAGVSASVKCEVTLENGAVGTCSVNLLSLKTGEEKIEGPNITVIAAYKAVAPPLDLGKGWKATVSLSGSGTVVVKPNWVALAKESAKLIAEMGVTGAIEMAGTMAVIFGPALFFAAGLSMIEDENDLWQWAVKEAREAERGAAGLSYGTKLQDNFVSGERAASFYAKGVACARAAIAQTGITEEAYKAKYQDFKAGTDVHRKALDSAQSAYLLAVEQRARQMYKDSISMRIFRTEGDVVMSWRNKAWDAWLAGLKASQGH